MGDGDFFIILAKRNLLKLGLQIGDNLTYKIEEDPNPLGVDIPEVLSVLLEQDENAKLVFDGLSDGKKRNLIFSINRIKSIDKQVEKSLAFLENQ